MRKKTIALILAMLTLVGCLAGCGQQGTENQNTGGSTSSVTSNSESDMPQNSEDSSMNESNNEQPSSDSPVVYFTSDIRYLPSVFLIPPAMTGQIIWSGQRKLHVGRQRHKSQAFCKVV